jgi:hypothetical protein
MSDQSEQPEGIIPSYNPVPTFYADAIANFAHAPGIVRTYLIRFDPALSATGTARPSLVAQLVMPTNGFLTMALFFEAQVKSMIASGVITQAQLEAVKQNIAGMTQ